MIILETLNVVALSKYVSHFVTVFQGTCQSVLISTFCTTFVFLHSKNFDFLHCLGLIDMLSANQNAEIFVCILSSSNSFHIYHYDICSLGWLVGCISDMLKGDCVQL